MSRPGSHFDTIVLIHDLGATAVSWENWIRYYSETGYRVIARSWLSDPLAVAPGQIGAIADYYQEIIEELGRAPAIIGHSFGGWLALLLLDRGLGAVGVTLTRRFGPAEASPVSVAIGDRARLLLAAGEPGQQGWQKVAEHVLDWAVQHAAPGMRKR